MAQGETGEVKELLQQIRGERSVTEFAADLGFSKQYISNVLCGNKQPSDLLLRRAGIRKKITINYEVFPGAKPVKKEKSK
jgi:transcriptional regulator with XRE-family HTH domain